MTDARAKLTLARDMTGDKATIHTEALKALKALGN